MAIDQLFAVVFFFRKKTSITVVDNFASIQVTTVKRQGMK